MYRKHGRGLLNDKYHKQQNHAKKRGIDWQFTFNTWLDWWGDDIEKRGRKAGQLVMARYNDEGPYHPDNCRKLTTEENTLEARQNGRGFFQRHSDETRAKISTAMKQVKEMQ